MSHSGPLTPEVTLIISRRSSEASDAKGAERSRTVANKLGSLEQILTPFRRLRRRAPDLLQLCVP